MKISFIATVFNEEKNIKYLLDSLFAQSKKPYEIIIVDGGSTDKTLSIISNFQFPISNKKIKILMKRGNRSVGRNEAIRQATGDIIACSDAGNILDKNWLKNITKLFNDPPSQIALEGQGKSVDVVAGYYRAKVKNIFQKCLAPYALVMEDKVDPDNFLPATRSVAFRKKIWQKVGGFQEKFSHNEDYVFAKDLQKAKAKIFFARDAIVYWLPRSTYKQAFIMFFRFAFGDAEAKICRTTVLLLFIRYIVGFYLIFLIILYKSFIGLGALCLFLFFYILWAIRKNFRYVKKSYAVVVLPLLQFTADFAVLAGTTLGLIKLARQFNYFSYIQRNKFLLFVVLCYIGVLFSIFTWGAPNQLHPFPYQMDEWHQLQAVRATFKYGTPNMAGAANGTMFHFLLSWFYLIPFTFLGYINPAVLKVSDLFMRERIFELLRLNTLLWGISSLFLVYKIADYIKASKKLALFLFTFTPIWFSLSGYFKYDIALIFWILLSVFFLLRFIHSPSHKNFIVASIPAALAVAVKISALPLLALYTFSYFWFSKSLKKSFIYFILGIGVFTVTLIGFGMPDTLFGKGNVWDYVYTNVITTPNSLTSTLQIGMNPYLYLSVIHYPLMFGHGLLLLFGIAFFYWVYAWRTKKIKGGRFHKNTVVFLFLSLFLFIVSTLPLGIAVVGNRTLVLLPFLVLIIALAWKEFLSVPRIKNWAILLICITALIQVYETLAWTSIKMAKSPQQLSSEWMVHNLPRNTLIGIENIPIYQYLPDLIQKEFYFNQYKIEQKNTFKYTIIDSKNNYLPVFIVLTNVGMEEKLFSHSSKKSLLARMKKEHYKDIATFSADFSWYKLIGTETDYYLSGIVTAPVTITIYKK